MSGVPRVAVGAIQGGVDHQVVLWALMDVLECCGVHIQTFLSQACFTALDGASSITGNTNRHLDSWLMSPLVCREIFAHGMRSGDLGIVEGRFSSAQPPGPFRGGSLDTICDWLDLPRLAVVDVSQIRDCVLPPRPHNIDGLILDRVGTEDELYGMQTSLEAIWGLPVLGGMRELAPLRAIIDRLPPGSRPSRGLCRTLGKQLGAHLQIKRLLKLAARRDLPPFEPRLFRPETETTSLNVAVAFDEAFHCYFPDTLDLLELAGASIHDFSPLGDEDLPPQTDLVYLGCGHPERSAVLLADNCCMLMALRRHVCGGGRIYAEGGGMAYLCQQIVLPDGRRLPMVGALPALARLNPNPHPMRPVELTLSQSNWLGRTGANLRGYLNTNWQIQQAGPLVSYPEQHQHRCDLVGRGQVIGSRLHLNFAAQPSFLNSFFRPQRSRGVAV